jgi:predicted lipoprotein with Yx(FWY)xxD motif
MVLRSFRWALAVVAASCASVATAGGTATHPTVSVANNGMLGTILVAAGGRTLYDTTLDSAGTIGCTGSCVAHWIPLVVAPHTRPRAGAGVASRMLGTTRRPDGRWQVTYYRHPLYLFSGDSRPGEANGQGLGGRWHAVTPTGKAVLSSTTSASGTGSAAATGSTGDTTPSTTGSSPPPGANVGMWCAANPKSCVNGMPVPGN